MNPLASLIFDTSGSLYGMTYHGGAPRRRYSVRIDTQGRRGLTEKVLHSFNNYDRDGANPQAGLVFDAFGNPSQNHG